MREPCVSRQWAGLLCPGPVGHVTSHGCVVNIEPQLSETL